MANKFFSGREGPYFFCDICGQPWYMNQAVRLKEETGRGGLIVCPNDADGIDFGLIPYSVSTEQARKEVRINHTNVTNGSTVIDYENTSGLGV